MGQSYVYPTDSKIILKYMVQIGQFSTPRKHNKQQERR